MKSLLVLVLLLFSLPALAVIETYTFNNDVDQRRYQSFVEELRCPKCQNQNLSGSNSPIAADLRGELYRLINEGKSDTEIVQFMLDRYGDFILYRPRFTPQTAILWLAPAILLLSGLVVVVMVLRRRSNSDQLVDLSAAEQQRLQTLLDEDRSDA